MVNEQSISLVKSVKDVAVCRNLEGGNQVNLEVICKDCKTELGEGFVWDEESNSLWFLDIEGKRLFQMKWGVEVIRSWSLPNRAGSLAIVSGRGEKSPLRLLLAFEDGFYYYDVGTEEREAIPSPYVQEEGMILNDGRCDRQGRFVCGGVNLTGIDTDNWEAKAKAYQVNCSSKGPVGKVLISGPFRCYNGTCFLPDGTTMYCCDSPSQNIMAYDYNIETGEVCSGRILTTFERGVPDGATVDAQGFLWVAVYGLGKITRINPTTGEQGPSYHTPGADLTTCCCFGGPLLDTLFTTTARHGKKQTNQPESGSLYALRFCEAGVQGLAEPMFMAQD